jgi:peptidoglycan hydrolase-like protein with peptidoglycan-binding domain
MRNRIALFSVMTGLSLAASIYADDNVREVQTKLSEEGLYSGEIDGAYSSDLSAALTRYQVRNGLPITGQLDAETSEALGAKPAVKKSPAAPEQSSQTWQRLRRGERQTSTKRRETSAPPTETETGTGAPPRSAPAAMAPGSSDSMLPVSPPPNTTSESTELAAAPPATASDTGAPAPEFSAERLRDYVAAFVLAGLDRNVGAEVEFFADRVEYYDQGTMDREKVREDLKRYDERWPERHFWFAGKITVEPPSDNRVRVTFPLGFKLRNANRTLSGKVDKMLVLEKAGDDLQIVAVNERKAE